MLCDEGYAVSLETSGALSIEHVDPRVMTVMDLKTPSSGEVDKNRLANLDALKPDDEIKFVVGDRADYEWVKRTVGELRLTDPGAIVTFTGAR